MNTNFAYLIYSYLLRVANYFKTNYELKAMFRFFACKHTVECI